MTFKQSTNEKAHQDVTMSTCEMGQNQSNITAKSEIDGMTFSNMIKKPAGVTPQRLVEVTSSSQDG